MHAPGKLCAALALWHATVAANRLFPRQTQMPAPSTTAAPPRVTAVTSCHVHDGTQVACLAGGTEYFVKTTPTQTSDIPAQYTGCHGHGSKLYCIGPGNSEVEVSPAAADADADEHHHDHEEAQGDASASNKHCHFHAGVEHCVGDGDKEEASEPECGARRRDYNIGLRVGLLFAILATSALGVFAPILLQRFLPQKLTLAFIVLKQFGTGIIVSTAFVHLYTHASLMFANKCIGQLGYEGTTSAILMAGLFLSFLVEYIGQRVILAKTKTSSALTAEDRARALLSTEVVSILVMEAGILFHSLLIGLTLVVAGDSFFVTLFVVILFHQVFEGLALGTRIAALGTDRPRDVPSSGEPSGGVQGADKSTVGAAIADNSSSSASSIPPSPGPGISMWKKLGLAALFAFITPIGMAIGIGVLQRFNGNDRSTLIAIGTLDALSAGILVWVGVVEMWAADWVVGAHGQRAELADANMPTVALAGFGLVAGMVLMSLLGKWA